MELLTFNSMQSETNLKHIPSRILTDQVVDNGLPSPANSLSSSPKESSSTESREFREQTPISDQQVGDESKDESAVNSDGELEDGQPFVNNKATSVRRCNYCGASQTPMWRYFNY
jgi:hypothetical protein